MVQKSGFYFFYFCIEWKDGVCHYCLVGGWVRKREEKAEKGKRKGGRIRLPSFFF